MLILDEPTKGIDVGAKYSIYEIMNELTANGYAIIMVSSENAGSIGNGRPDRSDEKWKSSWTV